MAEKNIKDEKLVEKYRPYLTRKDKGKRGIFTTVTRGNLLGVPVKGRKKRDKNYDFWYDVRNSVKTALVDLELFIETASEKNVNEVLTLEALEPIVEALLPLFDESNPTKAKIAQLFTEKGFEYIKSQTSSILTTKQHKEIRDAIELSRHLTAFLLPKNEQALFRGPGM